MRIKQSLLIPPSIEAAELIQIFLAKQVIIQPITQEIKTIVACDCAYIETEQAMVAVVMAFSYPDLIELEHYIFKTSIYFPYITGLLAFREAPAIIQALQRLSITPDLLMVDGAGIAHPRRLGLASHLGVLLNIPSIGVAKTRLLGTKDIPKNKKGAYIPLLENDESLGIILCNRKGTNPLYISPGHLCSIEDTLFYTLETSKGYRLPEPIRLADKLSKQAESKINTT